MISDRMKKLVDNNSVIREMFEEGKRLKKQYGEENVFDFSLGNPSVQPPEQVNNAIRKSLEIKNIHNYMNNSGYEDVRQIIADSLNSRFSTNYSNKNIIIPVEIECFSSVVSSIFFATGFSIFLSSFLGASSFTS